MHAPKYGFYLWAILVEVMDKTFEAMACAEHSQQQISPSKTVILDLHYDWEPEEFMMGATTRWKCEKLTHNIFILLKEGIHPMLEKGVVARIKYNPSNLCEGRL